MENVTKGEEGEREEREDCSPVQGDTHLGGLSGDKLQVSGAN